MTPEEDAPPIYAAWEPRLIDGEWFAVDTSDDTDRAGPFETEADAEWWCIMEDGG